MKKTLRVLVVDDDPTTRLTMKKILEEFGPVTEANDGLEGVTAFRLAAKSSQPFHLITLDHSMPVMDGAFALECMRGLEVVHHVRPRVVVLMMTAESSADTVRNALRAGADGYLVKPVDAAHVKGRVRELFHLPLNEGAGTSIPMSRTAQRA